MGFFIFVGVLVGAVFGRLVGGGYSDLMLDAIAILQAAVIDWDAFGLTVLAILGIVLIHLLGVVLFYSLAQVDTLLFPVLPPEPTGLIPSATGWLEPVSRGALIGTNAAVNFTLLWSVPVLQPLAIIVGLVNLFAAFPFFGGAAWFQVVLSWVSLLSPMSWLVTGVGVIFSLVNFIISPLPIPFPAGSPVNNAIVGWDFEWTRAAFVLHGGILTPVGSAYNMGNVVFIGQGTTRVLTPNPGGPQSAIDFVPFYDSDLLHELGHTLNVAAFGWLYHYFGAFQQNVFGGAANGYAELSAESNRRHNSFAWVNLWGAAPNVLPTLPAGPLTVTTTLSSGSSVPASLGALTDPEGRSLQFFWTFAPPMASTLTLTNPVNATQTFTPDVTGTYTLRVFVGDSVEVANPVTISVTVNP